MKWDKVYAAYRAGMSLREICRRFKISMRALVGQISDEQWKRASEDPKPEPMRLPVSLEDAKRAGINAAIAEAVSDVIEHHKGITRELRNHFLHELAEFQEFVAFFASFLDRNQIAELERADDGGKGLKDYLTKALGAFAKRTDVLEKLTRIGGTIIERERTVWALEKLEGDGGETQDWDDLLADIKGSKVVPSELPAEIIDFDQKLRERRQ